jgi:ribosome-binding protein aMBF1 (putative translation factor)
MARDENRNICIKGKSYSVSTLAIRVGMHPSQFSRIFVRGAIPRIDTAKKIADKLHVKLEHIWDAIPQSRRNSTS